MISTRLTRLYALPLSFALVGISSHAMAETLTVSSPDKRLAVTISDDNDMPQYSVRFGKETILDASRLGLNFKKLPEFGPDFKIANSTTTTFNDTWEQPWGEKQYITSHYNELAIEFENNEGYEFIVRFRVFDDGVGFRYEVLEHKNISQVEIVDEETEFAFASDSTAWWIPARGWNRYEYIYETTQLSEIDRVHTPFTVKTPGGTHVAIHEAALIDYAAFTLDRRRGTTLKTDLTPWYDGVRVKTSAPFKSSWRTIQVADDATGLLNSDLILNLNEPNKLGDVSWVEPGKYVGIWWAMHVNEKTWGSGDKHGATTTETKRYIDFAAQYGFDGVLVEGWNEGWDGSWFHNGDVFSFTKPYPDFDLPALAEYAQQKGVRLVGHHETSGSVSNYRNQMQDAYDLYEKMGVRQIKTGYVADGGDIKRIDENGAVRHEWHDGQFMANEYLHSVLEAAKRKISINTHEPIKDTGLRRTYPNWISREGARGQEFNAWGSPPNPPEHTAVLPYTRMLSGPMDFTPGIFNLAPYGLHAENRVQTTLAKQLALYVVLYSPIQMAADLPRHYESNMPAFQFIRDVPTDWSQSIALDGEVGDYVVFARKERDGEDWYLGGLTDENARVVQIDTDFLDKNRLYEMQIYQDGAKADWLNNPYEMEIYRKPIRAGQKLTLRMAQSGGVAIRLKAQK